MLSQHNLLQYHIHTFLLFHQFKHKMLQLLNQFLYLIHAHFAIKFFSLILHYYVPNHNHTITHKTQHSPHICRKPLCKVHPQLFLIPTLPYNLMLMQLYFNSYYNSNTFIFNLCPTFESNFTICSIWSSRRPNQIF